MNMHLKRRYLKRCSQLNFNGCHCRRVQPIFMLCERRYQSCSEKQRISLVVSHASSDCKVVSAGNAFSASIRQGLLHRCQEARTAALLPLTGIFDIGEDHLLILKAY